MDQDFNLGFNIDLESLERGLEQVDGLVNKAINGIDLRKADTEILSLSNKVQELRDSINSIADAGKRAEANFSFGRVFSTSDLGKLDQAVTKIRALRNELGGMQRDTRGRFIPNNTPLAQLTGAPDWNKASKAAEDYFDRMQQEAATSAEVFAADWAKAIKGSTALFAEMHSAMQNWYAVPSIGGKAASKGPGPNAWNPWLNATAGLDKYNNTITASKTLLADMIRQEEEDATDAAAMWDKVAAAQDAYFEKARAQQLNARPNVGMANAYALDPEIFGKDKEVDRALKSINGSQQKIITSQSTINNETEDWATHLGSTVARAAEWFVVWQVMQSAVEAVGAAFKEAISTAGEFQQQMVQMKSVESIDKFAGIPMHGADNAQVLNAASSLSAAWGDNINDVTQNIMLWYKSTGDLNDAIALTNESLKFQVATGTDLEDTYRTLTALSTQLGGTQIATWDKTKFSLQDTHQILNMVYAAAAVAGAGMRDVSSSGKQMGDSLNNAAGILLHSFDQDAEAMKHLGLNVSQIIALNQALITAMGNTGSEADGAAERMARLVAGFAALSTNSKASTLSKEMQAQFATMRNILNAQDSSGQKVANLVHWYTQLNDREKNQFSILTANQRGFQTMGNLVRAFTGNYDKFLKAEQDSDALNKAAISMNSTFNQQVKQLQGLWQGVVTVVGQELIPVLQSAVQWTMQLAGGLGTIFALGRAGTTHDKDFVNEAKYLGFKPKIDNPGLIGSALSGNMGSMWTLAFNPPKGDVQTQAFRWVKVRLEEEAQASKDLTKAQRNQAISIIENSKDFVEMEKSLGYARSSNMAVSQAYAIDPYFATIDGAAAAGNTAYWSDPTNIQKLGQANFRINSKGVLTPPPDNSGLSVGTPTAAGKGIQTPGDMAGTALDSLVNAYHNYVQSVQDAIAVDQGHISVLQHKMQLFGPTSNDLTQLIKNYQDENNQLANERTGLQNYANSLILARDAALKHAAALPVNTSEHKKWLDVADKSNTTLKEINKELADNGVKSLENYASALDDVNQAAKRYYDQIVKIDDTHISTATKNLQAGTGSFQAVVGAYQKEAQDAYGAIQNMVKGSVEWQDAMSAMHDKGIQAIDELKDKWDSYVKNIQTSMDNLQGRGFEDAFSMLSKTAVGDQKYQLEYYKQLVKSQTELNTAQIDYNTNLKEAGNNQYLQGLAQSLYNMNLATISLDDATAQYVEQVDEIMNSGFFQALDSAIKTLGDSASSGLIDQLFGGNAMRDQIFSYDELIAKLKEEKTYEDYAYTSVRNHTIMQEANHKAELFMLDQEIKKQEQLKKAEEDRLNHPSIFKKFASTFTKGIVDDMIKQLEQNMENSILKTLMPKQDSQLIEAMRAHVQGIQANFKLPAQEMDKTLNNVFDPDINGTFKTSLDQFDQTVKNPLQQSFSSFKSTVQDPFNAGIKLFQTEVDKFVKAIESMNLQPVGTSGGSGSGSSQYGLIGALAGAGTASNIAAGLDTTSINTMLFGNAAAGIQPSSSGTGIVELAAISIPAITSLFAAVSATNPVSQMQQQAAETTQALGGDYINSLGMPSVTPTQAQILNAANSSIGGLGGTFLSLGGGGTMMGDAAAGMTLLGTLSAARGMSNGGDIIGGSLVGMGVMGGAIAAGLLPFFAALGPLGIAAAIIGAGVMGAGAGGLFGPHYSQTTNPDMYANSGYAQGMANAMGNSGYVQAIGGSVSEDPSLSQALGGQSELQYLDAFVSAHPGGQGLSGAGLQLWQEANALTQGGIAQGVGGLHQGNIGITATPGGNSGPYWDTQNWQTLQQQIDNLTQGVLQFNQALQQGSSVLIAAFNQFGSGVGFFPYIWSIPGYEYPANPQTTTNPPGPTTNPVGPGTGPGGSHLPPGGFPNPPGGGPVGSGYGNVIQAAYSYTPQAILGSGGAFTVNTSVNLDGKVVARSVQSYALQTARRGFNNIV